MQCAWKIEVFYRSFKRTLGHHKLRSRSPELAKEEYRRLEHPKSAQPTLMKLLVLKGVTRWHKPEKFTALHATLLISYTLNPASQFLVAIRAILFYTYISGK